VQLKLENTEINIYTYEKLGIRGVYFILALKCMHKASINPLSKYNIENSYFILFLKFGIKLQQLLFLVF
jgi:hypothetical protein